MKRFLAAILLFLTVLALPELWFRGPLLGKTITWAAPHFGLSVKWNKFSASCQRKSPRVVVFNFSSEELKVQKLGTFIADIDKVGVKVAVRWLSFPPKINSIEEFTLRSKKIELLDKKSSQEPEKKTTASALPNLNIYDYLPFIDNKIQLGLIDISVDSFLVSQKQLIASLRSLPTNNSLELSVTESKNQVSANLKVPLTSERYLSLSQLEGSGFYHLENGSILLATLSTKLCQDHATCLNGVVDFNSIEKRGLKAKVAFKGLIRKAGIHLEIDPDLINITSGLTEIKALNSCVFDAVSKSNDRVEIKNSCVFRTFFDAPVFSKNLKDQFPTKTDSHLEISAVIDDFSKKGKYHGTVSLISDPLVAPLFQASLQLKSEFHGEAKDGLVGFHHLTSANLETEIPYIEKLVHYLHETEWAIPAPFNNLKGKLFLTLNSHWKDWETEAPFKLSSQMNSKEQSLQTSADGAVDFQFNSGANRIPHILIKANWLLSNVHLDLPRLEVQQIPRFFPDSRILSAADKTKLQKKSIDFEYDISVKTPPDHPFQIDSNFIDDSLFFDVNAHLKTGAPITANIQTKSFKFKVFRRDGVVEKMNLWLDGKTDNVNLDGQVKVQSGDYTVFTKLSGTIDKVRVELTSQPPVAEDELWAILLFGEPMDSLDIDQQDSTKSTEQALSQGGLGLLSLYAFANTPIERVSYDPATQRVGVSFRVTKGVSFELSRSDQNVGAIGLKKRFGGGWTLKTQVSSNDKEDEKNTQVGASLEWSARY